MSARRRINYPTANATPPVAPRSHLPASTKKCILVTGKILGKKKRFLQISFFDFLICGKRCIAHSIILKGNFHCTDE